MAYIKKMVCWVCVLCLLAGLVPIQTNAEEQNIPIEAQTEAADPELQQTEANDSSQSQEPPFAGEEEQTSDLDEFGAFELDTEEQPNQNSDQSQDWDVDPVQTGDTPVSENTEPVQTDDAAESDEEDPESIHSQEIQETPEAEISEEEDSDLEYLPLYHEVPLYFQTDYPDTMFGAGTIATSGCSITSLAMVATYMTGYEYDPEELARYFGGRAENNIQRLEIGSETLQLPFRRSENFHDSMAALEEGKIVIVLVGSDSLFTASQHFIILKGFNENGKIMVNDSYAPNYEKWELQRGFAEGFDREDILLGYSGGWIYDVDAMPDQPFIYSEPAPVRSDPRYPHIQLTYEEIQLLARVVWVEARGECADGQQAVAEVVLNRMASDQYSNSLRGVIYAENQFRSVPFLEDAEPYQAQYEAIDRAIYGPYVLPENVMHFATYPVNGSVWGKIGGHIFCYG